MPEWMTAELAGALMGLDPGGRAKVLSLVDHFEECLRLARETLTQSEYAELLAMIQNELEERKARD